MNPALCLMLPLALGQPYGPVAAPGLGASLSGYGCCAPCKPAGLGRPLFPLYQPPPALQPCPPSAPPAPVLAVKAVLPDGTTVTPMPGQPDSKPYGHGAIFGFRPGYYYPLQISNLPDYPGQSLYPVLEVRGSIVPRPGMKYMEFPAPLYITKDDIQRAMNGGIVLKVIYLEDPARAIPTETKPDRPIEIGALGEREAFQDAEMNGRIAAVLRLGDRVPDDADLARMNIDGTVLLPGQNLLAQPAVPPKFPCVGVDLYDPILGPKPSLEECFPNGGDGGLKAGIAAFGRVGGIDPTDVIAEYTAGSKRQVITSNIVCICSPRFVLRRVEIVPGGFQTRILAANVNQTTRQNIFAQREKTLAAINREKTLGLQSRERPGATVASLAPHALASRVRPQAVFRIDGLRATGTFVEVDELTSVPEGLLLTKEVEPSGPVQPGEILTITLRYHNAGRKPITDLVISDSLSGRLEYVPGSAAADRPSNVSTLANDVGSVIVQFELPGPIPASARGLVQFKVKVR